jgi:hypothetical protein
VFVEDVAILDRRGGLELVQASREDGLDAAVARGADRPGPPAREFHPRGPVAARQADDPQARAEALLGVRPAGEHGPGGRGSLGADRLGPPEDARRAPVAVAPVGIGHVGPLRRVMAADRAAPMRGDAAALVKDLDDGRRRPDVDASAVQRVWDTVVVAAELDVVVDVHARVHLPLRDLEALGGQRLERGPVEFPPERPARAVEAGERAVVEPGEALADGGIPLGVAARAI